MYQFFHSSLPAVEAAFAIFVNTAGSLPLIAALRLPDARSLSDETLSLGVC